jgi:CRP-like cAMP-binding protein
LSSKKSAITNFASPEEEDEIIQLSDGMCFGEWALLYNAPRKASALAIEDAHLFYLDKNTFDISFAKFLFEAETERKEFLSKIIPLFKKIDPADFYTLFFKVSVF